MLQTFRLRYLSCLNLKFSIAFLLTGFFLAQCGFASDPPGVVINVVDDFKNDTLGNPSIAILPNGSYVASHGLTVKGSKDITLVFSSSDRGVTWKKIAEVDSHVAATLFVHKGDLYLIGVRKKSGDAVISRSSDGGKTWTQPDDENSGLLTKGEKYWASSVRILVDNGRIFRAFEDMKDRWSPMVFSAPADSDLLKASNWTKSNNILYEKDHFGGSKELLLCGNILKAPNGSLVNFLCATRAGNYAAILPIENSGERIRYDPNTAYVDFPFRHPKYTIRYDERTKLYWAIGEKQYAPYAKHNIMALASSPDLLTWKVKMLVLQHVDSNSIGFRNSEWHFDGNDIVLVCAVSWDETPSYKDLSYLTFHRFKDVRHKNMDSSSRLLGESREARFIGGGIAVVGKNFSMKPFSEGELIFSNDSSRLKNLPADFKSGWKFTQIQKGNRSDLQVRPMKAAGTEIYFATAITQEMIDVTGWASVPDSEFDYGSRTKLRIFKRSPKRGEVIKIPDGNSCGGILLIKDP